MDPFGSRPYSSALLIRLPRPDSSETTTCISLPTSSRVDVLVRVRVAAHGGHVDAALMGKGRLPNVSQVLIRCEVGHLGHVMGHVEQVRQPPVWQALQPQLDLQVGDERAQVGVAAAFAVAVDGALHLDAAGAHRRDRVGHGAFAVVVGVDAQRVVDGRFHHARRYR